MGCRVNNRSGFRALVAWILTLGVISVVASQALANPVEQLSVSASAQPTATLLTTSKVLSQPEVASAATDGESAGREFIDRHSAEWGVTSQTARMTQVIPGASGLATLRFVQTVSHIDVLGTLLALTLDSHNDLVAFNVTTLRIDQSLSFVATLSHERAQLELQKSFASTRGVDTTDVAVTKLHAVVADSGLVPGIPSGLHIAWSAWTAVIGRPESVAVSVLDDSTHAMLYSSPISQHITYTPNVCDLQSAVRSDYATQDTALGSTGLVRTYGGHVYINSFGDVYPLCGNNYAGRNTESSTTALNNIDATWTYYKDVLNVDINDEKWLGNISNSINGDRNPRISAFTNVCFYDAKADCPSYGNAFWVPWSAPTSICRTAACSGIFMGAGYDQGLDVIAHELTHGLTFSIAFQDGFTDTSDAAALSEGLSDVFGEAAERLSPNSAPDPTWKVGENVTGADPGPYRVMKTGSSISSSGQSAALPAITQNWKSGDGHVNNGPLNRFAWLIANGATAGSTTIKPLGTVPEDGICHSLSECTAISRMSVLLYQALPLIKSTSSYFEFGQAVMNTCQTLVNTNVPGFDNTACKNVGRALRLTGISQFTIKNLTTRTAIKKNTTMSIVTAVKSYAGAKISMQPLQLQQMVHGQWLTVKQADDLCKHYCTNAQGRVTFSVKWSKSGRYRVFANSNFGAMRAQTPSYIIHAY